MKLTILERFLVEQLLPKEHKMVMLKEARELKERLSISAKENKTVDMRFCSDWNTSGCPQCGSKDFKKEKDGKLLTSRRICNNCGHKGAQGILGSAIWHEPKKPLEIEISDEMKQFISSALKALDSKEKIRQEHISLYDKFVSE